MDPLSIIAGSTGTVAFALASANTLYDFIGSIIDAPIEISVIARDVEALSKILHTLEGWLQLGVIRAAAASSLTASLNSCVKAMSQLQLILRPYVKAVNLNSLRWRSSFTWVMKKQEVRELRERLQHGKTTLGLSIGLINTYATETGNMELKEQIEAGNEALRNDLAALSSQVNKRRELKLDGASLGARQGSLFNGTDDGLVMRRYLEDLSPASHPWAGVNDIDEILSLKTFSVIEADSRPGTPRFSATASFTEEPAPLSLITRTTPLHRAVIDGNIRSVVELIRNGADPDQLMSDVGTCLHYCAQNDDHIMADVLILKGANIHSFDHKNRSPFEVALENRCTTTACVLIDHGAEADKIIDYMLKMTLERCGDREKDLIQTCLQHIADKGDESLQAPLLDSIHALSSEETKNLRNIWTGIGLPFDVDVEAEPGNRSLRSSLSRKETTSTAFSNSVFSDNPLTATTTATTNTDLSTAKIEGEKFTEYFGRKSFMTGAMHPTTPNQVSLQSSPDSQIQPTSFEKSTPSQKTATAMPMMPMIPNTASTGTENQGSKTTTTSPKLEQQTNSTSTIHNPFQDTNTDYNTNTDTVRNTMNPDYHITDDHNELSQLAHLLPPNNEKYEYRSSPHAPPSTSILPHHPPSPSYPPPPPPPPSHPAPPPPPTTTTTTGITNVNDNMSSKYNESLDLNGGSKPLLLKQFSWEI